MIQSKINENRRPNYWHSQVLKTLKKGNEKERKPKSSE